MKITKDNIFEVVDKLTPLQVTYLGVNSIFPFNKDNTINEEFINYMENV